MISSYVALKEAKGHDISDKEYRDQLVRHAVDAQLLSEDQVPYVDWNIALHSPSALIQAYYQYFETVVAPELDGKTCDNVFVYNGKASCETDSVFALETDAKSDKAEVLPSDRIIGDDSQAPLAILYADITSEDFAAFHAHLLSSALRDKIRYILRYKPSQKHRNKVKENLAGYGLELALKRTDYIVIDDRNSKVDKNDADPESEADSKSKSKDLNAQISKARLKKLGLRAANLIMGSSNKFETLEDVSLNWPKFMSAASHVAVDKGVEADIKANSNLMLPGQSSLLINGAPALHMDRNIYALMGSLKRERELVSGFEKFGLNSSNAAELISDNLIGEAEVSQMEEQQDRYYYHSPSLVWLNNIEQDSAYKEFPPDINLFLEESFQGQFYPIRHNANSIVLALDLSAPQHLELLGQVMRIIQQGIPIQFGIVPLTNTYRGREIAEEVAWISENKVYEKLERYLVSLLTGLSHSKAFKTVFETKKSDGSKGTEKLPNISKDVHIQAILDHTDQWIKRLDVELGYPLILANGRIITPTTQWLMEASNVLNDDLTAIREIVRQGTATSEFPIRDHLIKDALKRRNTIIQPLDRSSIRYIDTHELYDLVGQVIPAIDKTVDPKDSSENSNYLYYNTIYLTGDFANEEPLAQLVELIKFVKSTTDYNVRVGVIPIIDPNQKNTATRQRRRTAIVNAIQSMNFAKVGGLAKGFEALREYHYGEKTSNGQPVTEKFMQKAQWDEHFMPLDETKVIPDMSESVSKGLRDFVGLKSTNLIVSGRVVPLGDRMLESEDLQMLVEMEQTARVKPVIDGIARIREGKSTKKLLETDGFVQQDLLVSRYTKTYHLDGRNEFFVTPTAGRLITKGWAGNNSLIQVGNQYNSSIKVTATVDPLSERGQETVTYLQVLSKLPGVSLNIYLNPNSDLTEMPLKRFYKGSFPVKPSFDAETGARVDDKVVFSELSQDTLYNMEIHTPDSWMVDPEVSKNDLENIVLESVEGDALEATYELRNILLQGHARETVGAAPRGLALDLGTAKQQAVTDTIVMANLGYLQFQANPGYWKLNVKPGRSSEVYELLSAGLSLYSQHKSNSVWMAEMTGTTIYPKVKRKRGQEHADVLESSSKQGFLGFNRNKKNENDDSKQHADVNIFTVASGHLYERFLGIMTASVMKHSDHTVKFWLIEQFLSPSFKQFLPFLAEKYGFDYEFVTYKWPSWLRGQTEKQRTIWGYKILFLDVLFPQSLDKVIFVDADQIVRTDLKELVDMDLEGAPYGYTPMCDSREEIEGFRFWKKGYWKKFLADKFKYHISALYVVDLKRFRQMAAGDRIRQRYQQLSADPESLSNLDQDLPNNMQTEIPIFSLPQDWLWCETWCSDESLATAKTIDLCNNPMTKEPKLDRARRQIPEWVDYDNAIAELAREFEASQENAVSSGDGDYDLDDDDDEEAAGHGKPEVEVDHDEL